MMDFTFPTHEELDKQLKEAEVLRKKERENPSLEHQAFIKSISLEFWLKICDKVGIKSVPARFSEPILYDDLVPAFDGNSPGPTFTAAAEWLASNIKENEMWRWDCCAPYEIKTAMANCKMPKIPPLYVDDPRFGDIFFDRNAPSIKIAIRPWIKVQYIRSYPLEFRVYVFKEGENAISNYYPQRDLTSKECVKWLAPAKKLADQLKVASGLKAFTVDFLITEDDKILFLEGGPKWGQGSHPCCFSPEKLKPGKIALKKQYEGEI
jgi:hypothetical protein